MKNRLRVWLVDDREENRRKFTQRHGSEFDVKTFESPDQLLTAFDSEDPPDALLCDIFFYSDPSEREKAEARVEEERKRLDVLAKELHASDAADGIGLIKRVQERFHDRFPIYAYTSKGPYLLHNESFDQLEQQNARWLFKNKYSTQIERDRIAKDVAETREHNQMRRRIWAVAWKTGLVTAIIGAFLSVFLDRFAKLFGW